MAQESFISITINLWHRLPDEIKNAEDTVQSSRTNCIEPPVMLTVCWTDFIPGIGKLNVLLKAAKL